MSKFLKPFTNKAWLLADQGMVSGGGFITTILLARALGLHEFGQFATIGMVQLFLLSLNMAVGSQVFQVVYPSLSRPNKQRLLNGFLLQQLTLFLFFVAIGTTASFYFTKKLIPASILFPATLAIGLFLLQDFLRRLLLTEQKMFQAFLIDALSNVSQLILLTMFWMDGKLTQAMAWSVIAITFLLPVALGIYFAKPSKLFFFDARFAWHFQRKKIGWLAGSAVLQWGGGYFFVLAAGWWLGAAALGALRLGQYLFGLPNMLLQAIENYALPKAATGMSEAYLSSLTKKILLFVSPFILMLSFSGKILFSVLGDREFASATVVMAGLGLVYLVMCFGYPLRIAIRAAHLDRAYFMAYCFSVAFNIGAAFFLISTYGLYGVLAGMLLTQMIMVAYWLVVLKQKKLFSWTSFISS